MKSFWFFSFISIVFIFVFFFISTGSLSADVSTICCTPGNTGNDPPEAGDACYFIPPGGTLPVTQICRGVEGAVESAACGSTGLVCDDTCCNYNADCHSRSGYTAICGHAGCASTYNPAGVNQCSYTVDPGTYYCMCSSDPYGQYDCQSLEPNLCNPGFIPDCSVCVVDQTYNPCDPNLNCTLTCVAGFLGELGDPCDCPDQCADGYVCSPYGTCQPEDYLLECCDGPTDTSCPARVGYTNPRCALDVDELSGCPEDVNGDVYHCVWDPPLDTPAPTSMPYATPPPLPTTNWNLLYNTIQTSGGMFDLSTTLTLGGVISPLLRIIFPIAGLILLLILIYGGYNYMLSGGDPKKAAAAKGIITMAFVGFVIIFTAFWLVRIIGSILGLDPITTIF